MKSNSSIFLSVALCSLMVTHNLRAEEAPRQKDFTYTGIDGNSHEIKAYFPAGHQPKDRRPCFIFFHGGGWKSGNLNQGKHFCEYLSSRGIVALTANYSLHSKEREGTREPGNSKKTKQDLRLADGESRKRICVIDAKSVIRWVKKNAMELGVDPNKLIVSGASAGSHIGVLQMMDDKFNNPADPKDVDTKVQAFVLLAAAFTDPEKDKTPEVNVFQYVDKPFPPTLFICGETDRWATATEKLARKLHAKTGNDIEFWIAPEMGHMFFRSSEEWYRGTKLRIDRFLKDQGFLTGEPTLAPVGDQIHLRKIDLQTDAGQRETHESLATPPKNGIEVAQGKFFSSLLNKDVPYRVFSPENPTWKKEEPRLSKRKNIYLPQGMPIAIYVLNIKTVAPRPSSTSDREIIEDLVERGFLVANVDFAGAEVSDHEEWARDINGLIHVFGGKQHIEEKLYSENRKHFLNLPGPHEGREIMSFSVNGGDVPVHRNRIYVLPPGYTVEYFHVINKDFGVIPAQPELFMDIVYPMPGKEPHKLPVVLAQSATGKGDHVMNDATFLLYSWLFNGYALAVTCNVKYSNVPESSGRFPIVQAIRYLRGKKDVFSLNGIVGTTGISKSSTRIWMESYFRGKEPAIEDGPFPEESSEVSINWPACAHTLRKNSILSQLNEDSPAIILTWGPLNNKGTDDGRWLERARQAYVAKGLEHKLFYREVPQAGHEYPGYILNDIMAFWDKCCKSPKQGVKHNNSLHSTSKTDE